MNVVALAGGVGAGKFLRGLVRVVSADELTVVVNTGDDLRLHGLQVSPDIDSVIYWLADVADRERGWGRREESFRSLGELEVLGGETWFALGDLDLATHLRRSEVLSAGGTLSDATRVLARARGLGCSVLPMSDDPVTTRIEVVDETGVARDLHFQEYWVARGARDEVKGVRYEGARTARPAPGVLDAIAGAEVIVICPSNPVASIAPILAVPGVFDVLSRHPERVVGISPIVGGAPLRGMADRLMPVVGLEVSALGAAAAYAGLLGAWVIDRQDTSARVRIESELGIRVTVTDTIMVDDEAAGELARDTLAAIRA